MVATALAAAGSAAALIPSSDRSLNYISLEYPYEELRASTDDFSHANRVGQGAYGNVYKGILRDGNEVAIKYLHANTQAAGFEEEVKVLSKFRHQNLVILMGFARHNSRRLLVYELLTGGDLGSRLQKGPPLPWKHRINIALDAACGLSHLHNQKPKVFHRDIKSANILLDKNGTAKWGDFGLACLSAKVSHRVHQTAGTIGYADPRYITTSIVTEKSEVYSYGWVLVELLTAKPPAVQHRDGRISYFSSKLRDSSGEIALSSLMMFVDPGASFPNSAASALGSLALRCVGSDESSRPDFRSIVLHLRQLCSQCERDFPQSPGATTCNSSSATTSTYFNRFSGLQYPQQLPVPKNEASPTTALSSLLRLKQHRSSKPSLNSPKSPPPPTVQTVSRSQQVTNNVSSAPSPPPISIARSPNAGSPSTLFTRYPPQRIASTFGQGGSSWIRAVQRPSQHDAFLGSFTSDDQTSRDRNSFSPLQSGPPPGRATTTTTTVTATATGTSSAGISFSRGNVAKASSLPVYSPRINADAKRCSVLITTSTVPTGQRQPQTPNQPSAALQQQALLSPPEPVNSKPSTTSNPTGASVPPVIADDCNKVAHSEEKKTVTADVRRAAPPQEAPPRPPRVQQATKTASPTDQPSLTSTTSTTTTSSSSSSESSSTTMSAEKDAVALKTTERSVVKSENIRCRSMEAKGQPASARRRPWPTSCPQPKPSLGPSAPTRPRDLPSARAASLRSTVSTSQSKEAASDVGPATRQRAPPSASKLPSRASCFVSRITAGNNRAIPKERPNVCCAKSPTARPSPPSVFSRDSPVRRLPPPAFSDLSLHSGGSDRSVSTPVFGDDEDPGEESQRDETSARSASSSHHHSTEVNVRARLPPAVRHLRAQAPDLSVSGSTPPQRNHHGPRKNKSLKEARRSRNEPSPNPAERDVDLRVEKPLSSLERTKSILTFVDSGSSDVEGNEDQDTKQRRNGRGSRAASRDSIEESDPPRETVPVSHPAAASLRTPAWMAESTHISDTLETTELPKITFRRTDSPPRVTTLRSGPLEDLTDSSPLMMGRGSGAGSTSQLIFGPSGSGLMGSPTPQSPPEKLLTRHLLERKSDTVTVPQYPLLLDSPFKPTFNNKSASLEMWGLWNSTTTPTTLSPYDLASTVASTSSPAGALSTISSFSGTAVDSNFCASPLLGGGRGCELADLMTGSMGFLEPSPRGGTDSGLTGCALTTMSGVPAPCPIG